MSTIFDDGYDEFDERHDYEFWSADRLYSHCLDLADDLCLALSIMIRHSTVRGQTMFFFELDGPNQFRDMVATRILRDPNASMYDVARVASAQGVNRDNWRLATEMLLRVAAARGFDEESRVTVAHAYLDSPRDRGTRMADYWKAMTGRELI